MAELMRLDGKVALVTGAGSGIGKGAAILLAKQGARVGLLGRDEKDLDEVEAEICGADGECVKLLADVAVPAQMEAACDRLGQRFGTIDVVFANAGINGVWAPL